jgi:V8-like Glu-specific endopeptidase
MKRILSFALVSTALVFASAASAQVITAAGGDLTGYTPRPGVAPNYANAQPLALPMSQTAPPTAREALLNPGPAATGTPGGVSGALGNGKLSPVKLFEPRAHATPDALPPPEFGTKNQVFTTSRVNAVNDNTVNFYPFRAAGKLFFTINGKSFLCSASLIQHGLVVTAAHCVANYGKSQFYTGWRFVPAYQNGNAPYGSWTVKRAWIKTQYYKGTDNCAQFGVICPDDVAVLVLNSNDGAYPGDATGYLGTYWNGAGFNSSSQALITQLGYPLALDGGNLMERTDSQSFKSSSQSNNNVIGSLQTGGSSGGPWVVNLGVVPNYGCDSDGCTQAGSGAAHSRVVGVTSWGFNPTSRKYVAMQQGASPFTNVNICSLINSACFNATAGNKAACNITSISC